MASSPIGTAAAVVGVPALLIAGTLPEHSSSELKLGTTGSRVTSREWATPAAGPAQADAATRADLRFWQGERQAAGVPLHGQPPIGPGHQLHQVGHAEREQQ